MEKETWRGDAVDGVGVRSGLGEESFSFRHDCSSDWKAHVDGVGVNGSLPCVGKPRKSTPTKIPEPNPVEGA